jgi:hypothetical protein
MWCVRAEETKRAWFGVFFPQLYCIPVRGFFQPLWRENGDVVITVLLKYWPLASVAN